MLSWCYPVLSWVLSCQDNAQDNNRITCYPGVILCYPGRLSCQTAQCNLLDYVVVCHFIVRSFLHTTRSTQFFFISLERGPRPFRRPLVLATVFFTTRSLRNCKTHALSLACQYTLIAFVFKTVALLQSCWSARLCVHVFANR